MAVFPGSEPILDAVCHWKSVCLIESGSLFSSSNLWNLENFQELDTLFIQHPDESKRSFMEKLEDQLSSGNPDSKKLAAEVLWLIFLFPCQGSIKAELKKLYITRCWAWSGSVLDSANTYLADDILNGIGNPGIGFSSYRWKEFAYIIVLMEASSLKMADLQSRC